MESERIIEILLSLSTASGISGSEEAAVETAKGFFSQYVDQVKKDRFGNLLAFKKGNTPADQDRLTLAVVAHIDEIGCMVTKIEKGGFLRFSPMGGIDPRILPGQAVEVCAKKVLQGVIGAAPPHLLTEKERGETVPIEKLFIDVGVGEERVREIVSVGDTVLFEQKPLQMKFGGKVTGKSLDNRVGVAALVYCAAELSAMLHSADICFVSSLQEEVGLRGAVTAAYGLKPDLALIVDVTHGDAPGLAEGSYFKLGNGPALAIGPNIHTMLSEKIEEIARANYLPYQKEPIPGNSSTDAWAFQVSREGIPTALLSVPLRYMHTPVELVAVDDLISCGKLISKFCCVLDLSFLEVLKRC